jgi:aminoglycoside phosphotransferase family enzyme/predicted kinase
MNIQLDLAHPDAYPRAVRSETVKCIETHLSWVFLLDRDVFKIKKSVDLGFVDFTTLQRRKAACEAEVRLNARLAPGVYRGVVPIVQTARGLVVGGEGKPVEWAVHMRRLPDERRADLMLARGLLRGEDIERIAERIAAFHAAARCDAETTRHGSPELVRRNVFENFAQTAQTLRDVVSEGEAEEIASYQTWFLGEHAGLFAERMESRRVRDTHGDLRLEHVYLGADGEPVVIDCIEFNDRFRHADVCADIAFFSMDLAVHGRPDLAERLLARYARESHDFDLYALVDFYESYRAFVRGKVAMIRATDPGLSDALREAARHEARRYFLFALAAGRPSVAPPFLLAVGGLIASGKTTVAERLAQRLAVPVISSDRVRKQLSNVPPEQSLGSLPFAGAYSAEHSDEVYGELFRRASVVLASGRSVILDASFRSQHERQRARKLARAHGVPFLFAECRCSPLMARARLAVRTSRRSISDARAELFDAFARNFAAVDELPRGEHVVIDTEGPLEPCVHTLADLLAVEEPHRVAV